MTVRLVKLAVIYLALGMTLGILMGITGHHEYRSVHAHLNLLGWATLGLAAIVFHIFPQLAATRLATIWFWAYNVSLPIALGGLALVVAGHDWAMAPMKGGHTALWGAGLLFGVNVLWNLRDEPATTIQARAARA